MAAGKPVEIGSLDARVTFQKNSASVDRFGNHTNSWEDYFTCHAFADTWQREESGDEVMKAAESLTFTCRYCPELSVVTSTGYRILFNGMAYDILSVDHMNYDRRSIKYKAVGRGA